jgi:hypothetical protein
MVLRTLASILCFATVAALLAACAPSSKPAASTGASAAEAGLIEARDKLIADVRSCTDQHGYDPKQVIGIGENKLAPGELQWRQCCYDAARRYIARNPQMRGLYEQLIAEDIQLTSAIQQGTVTRTQRRARDEQLLAQIRAAEEAQVKDLAAQSERQTEQMRTVVDGLRGLAL